MNEQLLLNYGARLALQEAAKVDAAKVVDFAERRDEFERRVLRYFREERAAMLEEICAGNAAALAAVRLSDKGMAGRRRRAPA
jgi:hypothetical protein